MRFPKTTNLIILSLCRYTQQEIITHKLIMILNKSFGTIYKYDINYKLLKDKELENGINHINKTTTSSK